MARKYQPTDDLPPEARKLIQATERAIAEVQKRAEREIKAIQKKARDQAAEVHERADEAVKQHKERLLEGLRPLKDSCAREGNFDQALALYEQIRHLKAELGGVNPDPGSLYQVPDVAAGKTYLFEVTGSTEGAIYGSDVYTADSYLAVAAVHAGIVKAGQQGIVKVTVLDTSGETFAATVRNGVGSYPWEGYPLGFRISRA
jgi:hypothetical protein